MSAGGRLFAIGVNKQWANSSSFNCVDGHDSLHPNLDFDTRARDRDAREQMLVRVMFSLHLSQQRDDMT
jgi:hypothetical protein